MIKENRITSLDGLRGIAVLVVIAFHYINNQILENSWFLTRFGKPALILQKITYFGWSGVDLFFVLSGFLIGNILLRNKNSPSLFKTFYIRRFFRIIPAYYLLLIIFFILTISPLYNERADMFKWHIPLGSYFLFIQNFYMAQYNHFGPIALTPTWSLCVEEQFYLIIPFLVFITNKKYAWMFAVAGVILAIICRQLATNFYQGYTLLPSRIDTPMIGFLIAWLHQYPGFRDWVSKHLSLMWGSLSLLVFASVLFYVKSDPGVFGHTLLAMVFGLTVIIALYSKKGLYVKLLSMPFFLEMGKLSYFIYLYHLMINSLLHLLLLKQLVPALDGYQSIAITLAAFIVTYLLALASFRFLEKPVVQYSHQFKY